MASPSIPGKQPIEPVGSASAAREQQVGIGDTVAGLAPQFVVEPADADDLDTGVLFMLFLASASYDRSGTLLLQGKRGSSQRKNPEGPVWLLFNACCGVCGGGVPSAVSVRGAAFLVLLVCAFSLLDPTSWQFRRSETHENTEAEGGRIMNL
jgi:hypothetical protein